MWIINICIRCGRNGCWSLFPDSSWMPMLTADSWRSLVDWTISKVPLFGMPENRMLFANSTTLLWCLNVQMKGITGQTNIALCTTSHLRINFKSWIFCLTLSPNLSDSAPASCKHLPRSVNVKKYLFYFYRIVSCTWNPICAYVKTFKCQIMSRIVYCIGIEYYCTCNVVCEYDWTCDLW